MKKVLQLLDNKTIDSNSTIDKDKDSDKKKAEQEQEYFFEIDRQKVIDKSDSA